jgi:hypothetical protein
MTQQQQPPDGQKQYKTEWSFSFEQLGEQIAEFIRSLGFRGEEDLKTSHFSEPLGAAASARVRVDLSAGETVIRTLATADNLIEADITHIGEINFAVSGDTEKVVSLSQASGAAEWFRHVFAWIGSGQRLRWDVALSPNVPMDLDIHGGVGKCDFQLGALQARSISLNGGAGEIDITLPGSAEPYRVAMNGGVGETDVIVLAGATLDLDIRAGTGEIDLEVREGAAVNATISGGVGEVKIRVPAGAAVRIEGKAGIGDIHVPAGYTRLSGTDDFMSKSGVWQTANYDAATRKISIRYNGGVGALRVW